ncbi:transcription elongation factor GreA [Leptospira weilii]|uniref:Transcription elongation factor GreA n=1 Tax=Leptospira weilii str. 2006001855 TaxID=996804 RepID=M6FUC0_9LEPT|nr:transcription elongation factor GreA [Leptospira weilii]EMM73669.1 transcription elongation factor GreA/GreB, N-terminal domain protein [Leptospira weilii str. 2006001855]MCL8266474.1 transcription elongation factor GreA [Leptospira weilii]ULH28141.1 transcription elongation factor GreA [Leptospira weilii]UPY76830.1 transcription elongation factor GreA [Leptospira weilii]
MSNEISATTESKPASDLDKLTSLFNEEIYVRTDASSIPASKFKIFDDLIEFYKSAGKIDEAKRKIEEYLSEHEDSISARYLLGILSLERGEISDSGLLKNLLESFKVAGKWAIIEHITDQILKYGDQRLALKYKAEALEKLKKNKELKVVLEKLAKHDRKNPEILKKYALSILEENKERAITYLKQAIETFAKTKDYVQLEEIWSIIVSNNHEDLQFFERIERIMLGHRERTRLVGYLYPIVEPYKQLEDWDKVIYLLKKILEHEASSNKARNELIRAYKAKYANHSLLEDFLKMSEIGNNRKPIKVCIANFERNIVFDTNNYVLHRNWGVGKITSISPNGDSIFVDFKDKKDHKLSIQMAITSLKPLKKDHIWVKYYENKEEIVDLFQNNIPDFFKELLTSFNNRMLTADIKSEVSGKFLPALEWSKWWNKAKNIIKKEPNIGFDPKKKDELVYREKAISLSEELSEKFTHQADANKKLDIAMEALDNREDAEGAIEAFNHFYYEEEEAADPVRKIVAFLYLQAASEELGDEEIPRHLSEQKIAELIKSLPISNLTEISTKIGNVEIKKSYVNLIRKHAHNPEEVLVGILFEVPIKVNKYVFSILEEEGKFDLLNSFIKSAGTRAKETPEVFIWVAKSILTRTWEGEWLVSSKQEERLELILKVFRLFKPLAKIEDKGTKLKNACKEILHGNDDEVLREAIHSGDSEYIRKLYALYKEVPYFTDLEKERLYSLIVELKPDIAWEEDEDEDEEDDDILNRIPEGAILVTRRALNRKKEEFEHLLNVEMPENSKDIGEAQERGDLRENAEYKAAMERQVQLQAAIKRLEAEIKSAIILDLTNVKTDKINIGVTAKLKNESTGEVVAYSILGAWDADTEKHIISYQSPLAKSLLGKKVGDSAVLNLTGAETRYTVLEIGRFSLQTQED